MLSIRVPIAVALIALVHPCIAVCAPGQMAVGKSSDVMFTGGPSHDFLLWSGFLMTNNCHIISQNGLTQSESQLCAGGYFKGASVQCDSGGNPVGAVDTQGTHWTCSPTTDGSCNQSLEGGFIVLACCDRA
ncbi:hypothetical protein PsYK624_095520 [Phanerochaete sordida]|uniref:Secreted protein n=1 Tax=Phanerochaete sordida TaxID=48140 RepID=A0A9P3GC51_9APHY|nr:hypothetical protein PsYK624_095520 [Phanerochaete sordida]